MLLQTNSYIVPKEKRTDHNRVMRRFRQTLLRLGCDHFEVYEQVGANWSAGDSVTRFVQILRFRDRKHQLAVQSAERVDPAAQAVIAEFCDLINFQYQQQEQLFAVGFYTGVLPPLPQRAEEADELLADPQSGPGADTGSAELSAEPESISHPIFEPSTFSDIDPVLPAAETASPHAQSIAPSAEHPPAEAFSPLPSDDQNPDRGVFGGPAVESPSDEFDSGQDHPTWSKLDKPAYESSAESDAGLIADAANELAPSGEISEPLAVEPASSVEINSYTSAEVFAHEPTSQAISSVPEWPGDPEAGDDRVSVPAESVVTADDIEPGPTGEWTGRATHVEPPAPLVPAPVSLMPADFEPQPVSDDDLEILTDDDEILPTDGPHAPPPLPSSNGHDALAFDDDLELESFEGPADGSAETTTGQAVGENFDDPFEPDAAQHLADRARGVDEKNEPQTNTDAHR